jgi:hypothetical protein
MNGLALICVDEHARGSDLASAAVARVRSCRDERPVKESVKCGVACDRPKKKRVSSSLALVS